MRKILFVNTILLYNLFSNVDGLYDLKSEGYEQYQDILVKGEIVEKASFGKRYAEERFKIVNSILEKYQRPFTMLDIGAAQGYFSLRAAELYPDSTFVLLEGSNKAYPQNIRATREHLKLK